MHVLGRGKEKQRKMVMKEADVEDVDGGIVHPSQGFWFSLANHEIPEELLKKHRATLELGRLTREYGLVVGAFSLVTFVSLSYLFGRVLGLF
jgi:hypothetical protein